MMAKLVRLTRCIRLVSFFYAHSPFLEGHVGSDGVNADAQCDVRREAAAAVKAERTAAVEKLHGDATLAFFQWPGSRSGNRELLVLVRRVAHVRSGAVCCLLVGKAVSGARPSSCWEHSKSQGRYACYCKQRLRQLWEISASAAADAGEVANEPGSSRGKKRMATVGLKSRVGRGHIYRFFLFLISCCR